MFFWNDDTSKSARDFRGPAKVVGFDDEAHEVLFKYGGRILSRHRFRVRNATASESAQKQQEVTIEPPQLPQKKLIEFDDGNSDDEDVTLSKPPPASPTPPATPTSSEKSLHIQLSSIEPSSEDDDESIRSGEGQAPVRPSVRRFATLHARTILDSMTDASLNSTGDVTNTDPQRQDLHSK